MTIEDWANWIVGKQADYRTERLQPSTTVMSTPDFRQRYPKSNGLGRARRDLSRPALARVQHVTVGAMHFNLHLHVSHGQFTISTILSIKLDCYWLYPRLITIQSFEKRWCSADAPNTIRRLSQSLQTNPAPRGAVPRLVSELACGRFALTAAANRRVIHHHAAAAASFHH